MRIQIAKKLKGLVQLFTTAKVWLSKAAAWALKNGVGIIAGSALLAGVLGIVANQSTNYRTDQLEQRLEASKASIDDIKALNEQIAQVGDNIATTQENISQVALNADQRYSSVLIEAQKLQTRLTQASADLSKIEADISKLQLTDSELIEIDRNTIAILAVKTSELQSQVDTIKLQLELLKTDFEAYMQLTNAYKTATNTELIRLDQLIINNRINTLYSVNYSTADISNLSGVVTNVNTCSSPYYSFSSSPTLVQIAATPAGCSVILSGGLDQQVIAFENTGTGPITINRLGTNAQKNTVVQPGKTVTLTRSTYFSMWIYGVIN